MSLAQTSYSSIRLGLDRIRCVLQKLSNPQDSVRVIHVAGTNGKGSVCSFVGSVLVQSGFKTGIYTSPHLLDWRETIRVQQLQIPASRWEENIAAIKKEMNKDDPMTPFEIATVCSYLYFAQEKVDVAVVEVGLGGRLDATNVMKTSEKCAITSIGLDHMEFLGPTIKDIAFEKCGIIKPNVPVVYSDWLPQDAKSVLFDTVKENGSKLIRAVPADEIPFDSLIERISSDHSCDWFEYAQTPRRLRIDGFDIQTFLHGDFQRSNASVAFNIIQFLRMEKGWSISDESIRKGFYNTTWPARIHPMKTKSGLNLIVDGAHNTEAAAELRKYTDGLRSKFSKPIVWIFGCLKSKKPKDILALLVSPGDSIVCVPVRKRPTDAADVQDVIGAAREVLGNHPGAVHQQPSLASALNLVHTSNEFPSHIPVVCGSLYLAAELFEEL